MVTQLGLSPTSTLADVRTVLQNAIAQEEATISAAQERLNCYQQQLAALAALVSLSVETTNDATNGAASTPETNGTSAAVLLTEASNDASTDAAPPARTIPKRTGGKATAKTTNKADSKRSVGKATAKATVVDDQPQAQETTEPAEVAPPVAEVTPSAAPEVLADQPKLLKQFKGKSIPEAILQVLEDQPTKALTSKEITKTLYGATLLKDETLEKKLTRLVANNLTHGLRRNAWQKTGENPSLYQLLPSAG